MVRKAIVAVAAGLICIAAAPTKPTRFDLNCSGNTMTETISGHKNEPYSSHYRIDLASNQWCETDCHALHPIAAVQPASITLESKDEDRPGGKLSISNTIDRETGEQSTLTESENGRDTSTIIIISSRGQCEVLPFSGFPAFDTKF